MIESLKDLQKLLKLCRSQGVTEFKFQGVELKFGDMPMQPGVSDDLVMTEEITNPYANFPNRELSPEELMFFSSGGKPENLEEKAV